MRNLVIVKYRIVIDIYYTTYNIYSYGRWRTTCTSATPVIPQVVLPAPPAQMTAPPAQPMVSPILPNQPAPMPQINWSHIKPEFEGKPDEDAEAHRLWTNDRMDTHAFPEGVRIQRFCLTLVGEPRLWYESLRPIALDWNGQQNQFRKQYSKLGNTREHIFHAWRSFHFDENTETLDTYVTCIRQGAASCIRNFKNTLPMRLCWVLFPIDDLSLAVETAKRILTKEKIDRQLAGQSSSTLFMNIRYHYDSKKVVTFDTKDRLDNKIYKLTSMMSKLTAQGSNQNKQFKHKFIKAKGEDKQEITMIKAITRIDTDKIMVIEECHLWVGLVWTEL